MENDLSMETILDSEAIKKLLPHRYPFLFVDRIIELKPLERIVGIKQVSINESFFQGHFPGAPVMPGVLVIEALAQFTPRRSSVHALRLGLTATSALIQSSVTRSR